MTQKDQEYFDHLEALVREYRGIDASRVDSRGLDTVLVRGYGGMGDSTGAVSAPIYLTSTYAHPGYNDFTGFTYARCGNPTTLELEDTICLLEGGTKAFAVSSGMAAISIVARLFSPGDHILVGDDLYGGTYRLFEEVYARYGIEFTYVDACDLDAVRAAMRPGTRAVYVETPTNPMMKVVDLRALAEVAHGAGALVVVDNTLMTPLRQRPLEQGCDIVVHSGTKYLCGHNDVLAGFVVLRERALVERVFDLVMSEGPTLSPFDSWLMLRSLKTLSVRLERQESNARQLVEVLRANAHVSEVLYAGTGALVTFRVDCHQRVESIINNLRLILFAESLGGTETLITYPLEQTHGAIPEEIRDRLGITDTLMRLAVGIEDVDDLAADLEQAIDAEI